MGKILSKASMLLHRIFLDYSYHPFDCAHVIFNHPCHSLLCLGRVLMISLAMESSI